MMRIRGQLLAPALRRAVSLSALLVVPLLLSGCLLSRIYTFKDQLCDYEANFALQIDEDVSLAMHHPVLLDTDVTWLAGAEPTERRMVGEVLELRYVAEKLMRHPDPGYDIPLQLRFERIDGDYKLREGRLDMDLGALLRPEVINRSVEHTCGAKPDLLAQRVEVDLADLDQSTLPTRGEVLAILGVPAHASPDHTVLTYRYRLKNPAPALKAVRAVAWFDPSDQRLRRVKVRYLRYELVADFVEERAVIKVQL